MKASELIAALEQGKRIRNYLEGTEMDKTDFFLNIKNIFRNPEKYRIVDANKKIENLESIPNIFNFADEIVNCRKKIDEIIDFLNKKDK